jgi:hypothetical protein
MLSPGESLEIEKEEEDVFEKFKGAGLKGKLCKVCNKNSAELTFVESALDYVHGGGKPMCKACYDELVRSSDWYKQGQREASECSQKLGGKDCKEQAVMCYQCYLRDIAEFEKAVRNDERQETLKEVRHATEVYNYNEFLKWLLERQEESNGS